MKKIILLLLCISVFYLVLADVMATSVDIPDDAIRIRVIPNSNSNYDQKIKAVIKDELSMTMYDLLKEASSTKEARKIINSNLDMVQKDINNILEKENYNKDFKVNYGYNYFPKKEYKGVTYNEGYYESLLVTLGEGKGSNWWCVLFPPLCLIEAEESTDTEYKSLVKEIIDKYL